MKFEKEEAKIKGYPEGKICAYHLGQPDQQATMNTCPDCIYIENPCGCHAGEECPECKEVPKYGLRSFPEPCQKDHSCHNPPATTAKEAIERIVNSLGVSISISLDAVINCEPQWRIKIWDNEYCIFYGYGEYEEAVLEAYTKWRNGEFTLTEKGATAIAKHLLGLCECKKNKVYWNGVLHHWKGKDREERCVDINDLHFLDMVAHAAKRGQSK